MTTSEFNRLNSTDGQDQTLAEIKMLGPWFHNLHLPDGNETAPDHFLGDFPKQKWDSFQNAIPHDLTGWTALDIGCNAGFYSFELANRGAQVTSIDHDPHYLKQAQWAAGKLSLDDRIRFENKQVYDLAHSKASYDLVWFTGVFYHLRYPLLGLDIVARKTNKLLVFQTMTSLDKSLVEVPPDMALHERDRMQQPGWPSMAFIEHSLEHDPTNWWAANEAGVEAMLRSAGFEILSRPAHEIYICQPVDQPLPNQELRDAEYRSATGCSN